LFKEFNSVGSLLSGSTPAVACSTDWQILSDSQTLDECDADLEEDEDDIPLSILARKNPEPDPMLDTDEEFLSDYEENTIPEDFIDVSQLPEEGTVDENGHHLCSQTVTRALDLNHSGKKAGKTKQDKKKLK
jgi:hypothetical protein